MAYIPGEEDIESVEDDELVSKVYRTLKKLGGHVVWGSTRFDSHGYLEGFEHLPDMEALQIMFPTIEFNVVGADPNLVQSQEGLPDVDTFGDILIAFRTKGSAGWHKG